MNLNQVTIFAHKPLETVEFYQKLGLELIVDSRPRYARLLCPDGDSTLSIQDTGTANFSLQEGAANLSLASPIVLYFECDDLDGTVEKLKSKGLNFDEDPTDRPWLWRQAYLKDPNGNKICLFHAADNRKNPPWRVT